MSCWCIRVKKVVITSVKGQSPTEEVMHIGSHSCIGPLRKSRWVYGWIARSSAQNLVKNRCWRGGKCKGPLVHTPQTIWVINILYYISFFFRKKLSTMEIGQISRALDADMQRKQSKVVKRAWGSNWNHRKMSEHRRWGAIASHFKRTWCHRKTKRKRAGGVKQRDEWAMTNGLCTHTHTYQKIIYIY